MSGTLTNAHTHSKWINDYNNVFELLILLKLDLFYEKECL